MPSPVAAPSPRPRAVPAVAAVAGGSVTSPWRASGLDPCPGAEGAR
jgi:hypothetical protein